MRVGRVSDGSVGEGHWSMAFASPRAPAKSPFWFTGPFLLEMALFGCKRIFFGYKRDFLVSQDVCVGGVLAPERSFSTKMIFFTILEGLN